MLMDRANTANSEKGGKEVFFWLFFKILITFAAAPGGVLGPPGASASWSSSSGGRRGADFEAVPAVGCCEKVAFCLGDPCETGRGAGLTRARPVHPDIAASRSPSRYGLDPRSAVGSKASNTNK